MNRIQQFIWCCISALICVAYKADVYGGCTATLASSKNTGYGPGFTTGCRAAVIALGSTAGTFNGAGITDTNLNNNTTLGNRTTTQALTVPKNHYFYSCTKNGIDAYMGATPTEIRTVGCTTITTRRCPNPPLGDSGVTAAAQTLRTYANTDTQAVYVCSNVWLGNSLTNVYAFKINVRCTNESPTNYGLIDRCYLANGYASSDATGYWEIDGGACYYSSAA